MDTGTLYLVHLDAEADLEDLDEASLVRLTAGLYLAASTRTRSQLYHAVKRLRRPARLLVAPLARDPKFSGMAPGALKWVRGLARDGGPRPGSPLR